MPPGQIGQVLAQPLKQLFVLHVPNGLIRWSNGHIRQVGDQLTNRTSGANSLTCSSNRSISFRAGLIMGSGLLSWAMDLPAPPGADHLYAHQSSGGDLGKEKNGEYRTRNFQFRGKPNKTGGLPRHSILEIPCSIFVLLILARARACGEAM